MSPKRKVDLAKEAEEHGGEVEGLITRDTLLANCPKQFLPAFKKAKADGALVDLLKEVEIARLAIQKQADPLATFAARIKDYFMQEYSTSNTGVAGKFYRVQVKKNIAPKLVDSAKLYAHIKKKGEFDLLRQTLDATAVRERWDAGKAVPGVEQQEFKTISLTKI